MNRTKLLICLIFGIIGLGFVLLLTRCTPETATGGETGNELVSIYMPDGVTPARNATVSFFRDRDSTVTPLPIYVTLTDNNGQFSIQGVSVLKNGLYNVWIQLDTLVTVQTSVFISPESNQLRNDTLNRPLALNGTVGIEPIHDPKTVSVAVLGSDKNSIVDSAGRFTINGLTKGSFTLKLISTIQDYVPTFYSVAMVDSDFSIQDTVCVQYTGIPVVKGLEAAYDLIHKVVLLHWQKTKYTNFKNYVIYRTFYDSLNWPTTPIGISTDTFFVDSVFSTINSPKGKLPVVYIHDTAYYHVKYRIRIQNNLDQIGLPFQYVDIYIPKRSSASVFFIIDNSGSMGALTSAALDTGGSRFIVTHDFIDTIKATFDSLSEVGIAVFANYLWFNPVDHQLFKKCPGYDTGAYIPLLELNMSYPPNGATGFDILRFYLDTTVKTQGSNSYIDLKYTPTQPFPVGTLNQSTCINAGFDAARDAFAASKIPKNCQCIIFLSDGDANIPQDSTIFDYVKGDNVPTTFTIYFTKSNMPPQNLVNMTNNIKANGYSSMNLCSGIWAINTNCSVLMKLLRDSVLTRMVRKTKD